MRKHTELERVYATLSKSKRISNIHDDGRGMAINTRMPGSRELTDKEKKTRDKNLNLQRLKRQEERVACLREHPPLEKQLSRLNEELVKLKEKYPNEETITDMEKIILQTKEDHVYDDEWDD